MEPLFNKAVQACNFIKKRLQHRCFPWNIVKFLRTLIFKNNCDRCFCKPPIRNDKDLFVLQIFKFLVWVFGHVGKRLDKKAKANFKIHDVMNCEINTHIARYLKKQRQSEDKIWLVNRYNMRINFLENLFKKKWWRN